MIQFGDTKTWIGKPRLSDDDFVSVEKSLIKDLQHAIEQVESLESQMLQEIHWLAIKETVAKLVVQMVRESE